MRAADLQGIDDARKDPKNAAPESAELLENLQNIFDCIYMADDNAAGQGYDADSCIRRHLGYAMAIINKAIAKHKG